MHHASVDKLAVIHKMNAYFPCPSDKREDKEEENNDPDRIGANVSGIFDSQVVFFLPKRIEPLWIQFSPDRSALFYDLLTYVINLVILSLFCVTSNPKAAVLRKERSYRRKGDSVRIDKFLLLDCIIYFECLLFFASL